MPPKRKCRGGAVSGRGRKGRRVRPTFKFSTAHVKCVAAIPSYIMPTLLVVVLLLTYYKSANHMVCWDL